MYAIHKDISLTSGAKIMSSIHNPSYQVCSHFKSNLIARDVKVIWIDWDNITEKTLSWPFFFHSSLSFNLNLHEKVLLSYIQTFIKCLSQIWQLFADVDFSKFYIPVIIGVDWGHFSTISPRTESTLSKTHSLSFSYVIVMS